MRQEKILKLISTELTKNTTRVVEMAVKAEVQNSVLPSLENITKNEVKTALRSAQKPFSAVVDVHSQLDKCLSECFLFARIELDPPSVMSLDQGLDLFRVFFRSSTVGLILVDLLS